MLKFVIKLRDYLSDLIVNVVPVLSIPMILYLLTVFINFFKNRVLTFKKKKKKNTCFLLH